METATPTATAVVTTPMTTHTPIGVLAVDDVELNATVSVTEAPLTVRFPPDGLARYPETAVTPKGYVPLITPSIVYAVGPAVIVYDVPLNVTLHIIPAGSPVSANFTV